MLDCFHPTEIPDHSSRGLPSQAFTPQVSDQGVGYGAWPASVSVTKVAWNEGGGLAGAGLLASGTASGLCRVDWLGSGGQGRWWGDGKRRFEHVWTVDERGRREGGDGNEMDVDDR